MPYTPLIPVPPGSENDNDNDVPDPFDELLRPTATASNSKSIFSTKPAPRRRTSKPINIPRTSGSTSASHINATAIMTPPSASSEFGAFVSVSPSQDPLGIAISPNSQPYSPIGDLFSGTEPSGFVEAAKRRTEDNERRIVDELLVFEEDPTSLINNSVGGASNATSQINPQPEPVSREKEIHSTPMTAPHRPKLSARLSSSLEEALSTTSLHERSGSGDLRTILALQSSGRGSLTAESSPILTRHNSSPRISAPNGDAPHDEAGSLPMSASFSSYISGTFPRKWSTLLRSPSGSSLSTSHPRPAHATTIPETSQSTILPSRPSFGLTHDSPFAAHLYIPPSGAPGFDGDRNWDKGFEFTADQKVGRPAELVGRSDTARPVLSYDICQSIRSHLPPLFRLAKKWSLLYSLDQHGISLATFYSRVSPHCAVGGCLLAVRDSEDRTFGVWIEDGIKKSSSNSAGRGYYGSGESFLWKQERDNTSVQVFKWTGKNDYVALCESDYISFGGGDGKYGLFLDSSFCDGTTATCPTFDNDPLCGLKDGAGIVRFECVGLEAWGIAR